MDDTQFDRSIRFAAFLIGGVLFLTFGVEYLVSGVIDLAVECTSPGFNACSGNQVWQVLAPVISGVIVVILAIVFFVLAFRTRRPSTPYLPPPP
ncbi:MAG: hypothetical protein ACLP8Y_00600 [Thermoplasmata archaeon]